MRIHKKGFLGDVHKITTSASLMNFFLVSTSFLKSEGGEIISRSSRASILPRTCRPVVPASPSIKTLYLAKRPVLVDGVFVGPSDDGENPRMLGAAIAIAAMESFMLVNRIELLDFKFFCQFRKFVSVPNMIDGRLMSVDQRRTNCNARR